MKIDSELMRGAGPVAVLRLLTSGEMYGYELVEALSRRSEGVLAMGQSTLYPMLYNLEAKGLVKSRWATSDSGRERRYYAITGKGRKKLSAQEKQWGAVLGAMTALGIVDAASIRRLAGARA